ncbi:hypothetical protein [Pelagibacterium sp. H642]|uniref:hypothetical protein n=1 Tax=Pelagibacterium sp. H642 TaxID=1881069 RepID=UPI002815317B|nr:hypothetical protein [Pelagibacterium sp. H642]WMT90117.1 hypothetical protein NO934_15160 [Pelagibacterium sp. H642]
MIFTEEEKAFYNPDDRVAACNRDAEIDAAMTEATDRLAMVLFGIERYGRPVESHHSAPPLHKDLALNLMDAGNRQALREALDTLEVSQ